MKECRQQMSPATAIGGGVGLAPLTLGKSLFGSLYGVDRADLVSQKLKFCKAELNRQDTVHYEPRKA